MHAPIVAHPIESGAADGEARLAARMIELALFDARAGDPRARHFLVTPQRIAPWAALLHIAPERLSALAAEAIAATRRPGVPRTSRTSIGIPIDPRATL
jgi:hypothetical protein